MWVRNFSGITGSATTDVQVLPRFEDDRARRGCRGGMRSRRGPQRSPGPLGESCESPAGPGVLREYAISGCRKARLSPGGSKRSRRPVFDGYPGAARSAVRGVLSRVPIQMGASQRRAGYPFRWVAATPQIGLFQQPAMRSDGTSVSSALGSQESGSIRPWIDG